MIISIKTYEIKLALAKNRADCFKWNFGQQAIDALN